MTDSDSIDLTVDNLHVEFASQFGVGYAVEGVSFEISRGEVLGLVGESGSGKSVTSLAILGLLPSTASTPIGHVWFEGQDLLSKTNSEMRAYRGNRLSMILQDPMASLNPIFTIEAQISEALRLGKGIRGSGLRESTVSLLELMRIPEPERRMKSYPHQFSGGMRQRVVGSIALAGDPEILIADEPTTALDVTIQAAYLKLLRDVQDRTGVGILFITHDLGVVGSMCDRVAVMYAGQIVELASTAQIFGSPRHPYTKALASSVPDLRSVPTRLPSIGGSPPSIYARPSGCRFRPRCWLYAAKEMPERCRDEAPMLVNEGNGRSAACHFAEEVPTLSIDPSQVSGG